MDNILKEKRRLINLTITKNKELSLQIERDKFTFNLINGKNMPDSSIKSNIVKNITISEDGDEIIEYESILRSEKLSLSISSNINNIKINEEYILQLEGTSHDKELLIKYHQEQRMIRIKNKEQNKKNDEMEQVNKLKKIQQDKQYKLDKKEQYYTQNKEREIQSAYKHFINTCSKLPDWMDEKLNRLPANHSYLFRGILFMGKKPCEKLQNGTERPVTLIYDEQKGGITTVIETNPTHRNIYTQHSSQNGKYNPTRNLVSSKWRKIKILT